MDHFLKPLTVGGTIWDRRTRGMDTGTTMPKPLAVSFTQLDWLSILTFIHLMEQLNTSGIICGSKFKCSLSRLLSGFQLMFGLLFLAADPLTVFGRSSYSTCLGRFSA